MTYVKQIRTESDYQEALARAWELMNAEPGTPEDDELDVLASLVSVYEDKHFPMGPSAQTTTRVPLAEKVRVADEELVVILDDGGIIVVPFEHFPRLRDATPAQREHVEFIGGGLGLHWPDLDEDLSVQGLLRGQEAGWR